jgi:hypothetical protein
LSKAAAVTPTTYWQLSAVWRELPDAAYKIAEEVQGIIERPDFLEDYVAEPVVKPDGSYLLDDKGRVVTKRIALYPRLLDGIAALSGALGLASERKTTEVEIDDALGVIFQRPTEKVSRLSTYAFEMLLESISTWKARFNDLLDNEAYMDPEEFADAYEYMHSVVRNDVAKLIGIVWHTLTSLQTEKISEHIEKAPKEVPVRRVMVR